MSEVDEAPINTEALEKHAIDKDLEGNKVNLNREVPFNHKWFKGEFHSGSWGSDSSPFAGRPEDRVRVSMPGKKMTPAIHNGVGSVYGVITAVVKNKDRQFIGQAGWWRTESLSHSAKTRNIRRRYRV